ncbi:ERF family protein [Gloeobacter kilaueensis]|uniref:ERF family protein n=1 Tax=Gloeobacter kilaueensis (strain ATCC BAA-2537 / CCAP 1431/1 / ULC 316 / JS1) TaxID=1183438 RepID=U5QE65_GLOK1|nr:ERF family protein [Gloeobacter kilaueensis]AGY57168.1 hypothetical protein GKIL_0922 [Gloeobacter kilaueensis JS1]
MASSTLHQKIAKIQGQLEKVPKTGENTHHRYRYATEADLLAALRPLCSEAGISLMITCTSCHIEEHTAQVMVRLTITDSESGEVATVDMPGFAADSKGDKAVFKALTGAAKYAYWKAFAQATGDDPENDAPPGEATSNRRRAVDPIEARRDRVRDLLKAAGVTIEQSKKRLTDLYGRSTVAALSLDQLADLETRLSASQAAKS